MPKKFLKLTFSNEERPCNAAISRTASFLCMWSMHKRRKRKREFSSELQMCFDGEHDGKKSVTPDNQTYLLLWWLVRSFPAINRKACMLKGKGIATKMKQKEQFLSEFSTMEATNTWKMYAGDNNQTYWLPWEFGWLQQKSFF